MPQLLVVSLLLASPPAHADAVVAECTPAGLLAALAEGGRVTFAQDCEIALTTTLRVTNEVWLDASGHTVTLSPAVAAGGSRLFEIMPGARVIFTSIRLDRGRSASGGALLIQPEAVVAMTDCRFTGNQALGNPGAAGDDGAASTGIGEEGGNGDNGTAALGGAICNHGQLSLLACQFLTNSAVGGIGGDGGTGGPGDWQGGDGGRGGNGGAACGGAIYSTGSLVVSNCTFSGNRIFGGHGGAGGAAGAGAFPSHTGNGGAGGACQGAALCAAATSVAVNCAFSDNHGQAGNSQAGGQKPANGNGTDGAPGGDATGGGWWSSGIGAATNCTFALNSVTGGNGGAGGDSGWVGGDGGRGGHGTGGSVYNAGTLRLVNCTVARSGAFGGTNGPAGAGGTSGNTGSPGQNRGANIANGAGTFTLENSILAYGNQLTNSRLVTNIVSTVTNVTTHVLVTTTNTFGLVNGFCEQGIPLECYTNIVATNETTISTNTFFRTNCLTAPRPVSCFTNLVFTNHVTTNVPVVVWVTNVVALTNIAPGANAYGPITDAGHNLSSDATPPLGSASRNHADPQLGPLADNGGPTLTMLPLAGSPARDAGDDLACPPFDQRGVPRPAGARSDIGAVEVAVPATTLLLWPTVVGTDFAFAFPTDLGLTYVTESTNALTDAVWTRLQTNLGTGGLLTNVVPVAESRDRFFRVSVE